MHTHTYAHEKTCACMTPSTRWSTDTKTHNLCTNMHTHTHTHVYKRIDVQIHTHMHMYSNIHVRIYTHIHIYTHTHTKCIHKHMQARLERRRGSERARSRCRPRKLCTSFSFDTIKPHFAPPKKALHSTHVLQHQYLSSGATEPQYASTQESKPENDQSDCSGETKGQWRTINPRKQPIMQITTARRPDNSRSSALVRSQSTKFMANLCRELWSHVPRNRITFPLFKVLAVFQAWFSGFSFHFWEIEKFIIRQPPIGEKDDYDSENSWISDGLPSSSFWAQSRFDAWFESRQFIENLWWVSQGCELFQHYWIPKKIPSRKFASKNILLFLYSKNSPAKLQLIPEKMRLEMVNKMQIEFHNFALILYILLN